MCRLTHWEICWESFRPLARISCNSSARHRNALRICFRSLAGVNYNAKFGAEFHTIQVLSSPHGDKLQHPKLWYNKCGNSVFVPLRSINLLYHTLSQKKRTIHRRSTDGAEMISHKDHLDSAEGASKPSMGRPRKYSSMRSQSCSLEKPLVNSQLISCTASVWRWAMRSSRWLR